jgi:hypothetical protein
MGVEAASDCRHRYLDWQEADVRGRWSNKALCDGFRDVNRLAKSGRRTAGREDVASQAFIARGARRHITVIATGIALSACASQMAQVPPRLDLGNYQRIALVTFSVEEPRTSLGQLATRRFAEEMLASQSGFELLELGPADSSLARLVAEGDAPAAAQALGREKQFPVVFFGQLVVTDAKPRGSVSMGGDVNVGATVSGELNVRLLSTSTGGTLWRSSGTASQSVGQIAVNAGRMPSISASDPNAAYANMVNEMVAQVTRDFRPTWVKQ